jgi:septum formation protein
MKIILGSHSPRRREIMDFFSLPFLQVGSDFSEETVPFKGDPAVYATVLSQKKGEALASKYPQEIILTADTVVFHKGKVYNKPADEKEAFSFLAELCGNWHSVYTGVTVRRGSESYSSHEETRLLFNALTPQQIQKFHHHCYFLDKAGGYAIEKSGNLLVSRIEGCYYNVLGLPMNTVRTLLLKLGIDLWDYLKSFS